MSDIPWAGLLALLAMFVLPLLPDWLFEGLRTIKHRPRRHICGDCNTPWTDGHTCTPEPTEAEPPIQGQLRRTMRPAELDRRPAPISRDW